MTEFEPRTSEVRIYSSTNWATTTALLFNLSLTQFLPLKRGCNNFTTEVCNYQLRYATEVCNWGMGFATGCCNWALQLGVATESMGVESMGEYGTELQLRVWELQLRYGIKWGMQLRYAIIGYQIVLKNGNSRPLFAYFRSFQTNNGIFNVNKCPCTVSSAGIRTHKPLSINLIP